MEATSGTMAPVPHGRRTWRLLLAGAIILCSGIAIGVGLGVRLVRASDPGAFLDPDRASVRLVDILAWQLGLDAAQRESILKIFESKRDRIDAARSKIYPEIQGIAEEVRHEVAAVLTRAQAELWNQRFDELRERWRPRGAALPRP